MKSLVHRLCAPLRPSSKVDPDVGAATPLVHLLEEAEPASDLFAKIEARLDDPVDPPARARRWLVIGALLAGLVAGNVVTNALSDRQKIVARQSPTAVWIPLGSVTLHGSGLRDLVRAKCRGHTHFLITMHGHAPTDDRSEDTLLMGPDEKILMECIF